MATRFQPFPVADLMQGFKPDWPTEQLKPGTFAVAQNVRFYDGFVRKTGGWTAKTGKVNSNGEVAGLITRARFQDGTDAPVIATDQNVYYLLPDGTVNKLNAAAFTPNPGIRWETCSLPSSFFLNRRDGTMNVMKWDRTTFADINDAKFGTMYGNPPQGMSLEQFKAHVVVGALTNDGSGNLSLQSVALSDLATGALTRGEFNWMYGSPASESVIEGFFSGNDNVVRVLRMGDYLVVYKENTIDTLAYIGGQFVYLNQEPITYMGVMCPSGVIGVRGVHVVICQDDIYIFNGSNLEPIGDGVFQYFKDNILPDDPYKLWSFNDILRDEVVFVGKNNLALTYNYVTRAFSTMTFPFTAADYVNLGGQFQPAWDEATGTWAEAGSGPPVSNVGRVWISAGTFASLSILGADAAGNLYTLFGEGEQSAAGTAINSRLETGFFDCGEPGRVKMVNEIRFDGNVNGAGGSDTPLQVYVAGQDNPQATVSWQGPFTVYNNRATFTVSGRYHKFGFVKNGGYFDMTRFSFFWRLRGRF